MSNQPIFDPLKPTSEGEADMLKGYLDGYNSRPAPSITSIAYDHGRRNDANDRARVADPDQIELARRMRTSS